MLLLFYAIVNCIKHASNNYIFYYFDQDLLLPILSLSRLQFQATSESPNLHHEISGD